MDSDPRETIEGLRDKIASGERGGSEPDREALLDFSDQLDLLATEYSDYRHLKLLNHGVIMAEQVGGLADAVTDREAAEPIVRWINATYSNEETNRDYRSALRVIGKRLTPGTDVPDCLDWVPTGTSRSYDPAPDPSDMLEWAPDIEAMLEACRNTRDEAMVALQFEAGCRPGEFYDLTVGDVSDAPHGLRIMVDGKTGQRSIPLVKAVTYVNRWMADHPSVDDSGCYLWTKLNESERISHRRVLDALQAVADRAGVTKPVTPRNLRRSNTAWLAMRGVNESMIQDRQGRQRGSEHVARYMARFGQEWEEQYAAAMGVAVSDPNEPEVPAPVDCPRCDKATPASKPTCQWCNQSLDTAAAETLDRARTGVKHLMVTEDEIEDRAAAADALERLESDPEFAESIVRAHLESSSDSSS